MSIHRPTSPIGSLHRRDGAGVVRLEDHFETDSDDLWDALTSPDRLARWIAEVDGDLRLGGHFEAVFTSGWRGPGRVDACEPGRRLLLTMGEGDDQTTPIRCRDLDAFSAMIELGAVSDSCWRRWRPETPVAEMAPRFPTHTPR